MRRLNVCCMAILLGLATVSSATFATPSSSAQSSAASRYKNQTLTVADASEITLDGASAISLTFSVPLQPDQDFASLVSITDEQSGKVDGSWELTKNQMELRFRHIEPKRKLVITVSDDLKSVTGGTLTKEEQYRITTRDLQPSVGFASRGSLLPAKLAGGLPIVTLNVNQVDVDFFRIKPDKLVNFITRWGDSSSLNWTTRDLMPMADLVFGSRFDLKPEKNTRQTVLLPLDNVTAMKTPGVYVAVMHQSGSYDYYLPATLFTRSDIGISMHRYSSSMALFTQNLATGAPLEGIQLQSLNDKGEIVETTTSDKQGIASLHWNSKIRLLLAQQGEQVSMIPFNGPSLDLSEYKIDGDYEHDNKLFFFGPRDLYRPGETVVINALLRDKDGHRISDQPIKADILNANGESVRSFAWTGDAGFYQYQYPIDASAGTGSWHLKATLGDGEEKTYDFKVEDFLPERMALTIKNSPSPLTARDALNFDIEGHYLYGAPAAGNTLNGNLVVQVARTAVDSLPGYLFGNNDDKQFAQNITLEDQTLNDQGKGVVTYDSQWSETKSPLNVVLIANLQESGGRPVTRRSVQAVWPAENLPAIHPLFLKGSVEDYRDDKADLSLDADSMAEFNLALVSADGKKHAAKELVVRLVRERDDYYWSYLDGVWDYTSNKKDIKLAEDHVSTQDGEDVKVSYPVEWGGYRLELIDPLSGAMTSVRFWAGYRWDENNGDGTSTRVVRPDQIKMTLDKTSYAAGDTARVKLEAPAAGQGYLLVESKEGLLAQQKIELPDSGKAEFTVPIQSGWQQHDIYLSTIMIRPATNQENKTVLPKRAVGIIHLPLLRESRHVQLELQAPVKTAPNQPLKIHLKTNSKAKQLHVVVSAVDAGVLNITDFVTPDPFNGFFGKRNYGVDQFDVYGQLIEGTSAPLASMRYGGDEDALHGGKKPQPTVLIVAQQAGMVTLNEQGEGDVSFDIPDFNGELRVMAQVWSDDDYGAAEQKVTVAAPLITQMAMPRFLAGGDTATLAYDLTNNSGQPQDLKLSFKAGKKLSLTGNTEETVSLKADERKTIHIPVKARNGFGDGTLSVTIHGVKLADTEAKIAKDWRIPVRPAYPAETLRYMTSFNQQKGWLLPVDELKNMAPDSLMLNLQVTDKPALDVATQIRELQAYPYGCLEQTTSGIYPSLYLNAATLKQLGITTADTDQVRLAKVQTGIDRLLGMQLDNGGFSLWDNTGSEEYWLTAYVTDFLFRARDMGLNVPAAVLDKAQQRLLRYVQDKNVIEPYYSNDIRAERFSVQAYAGLVLAQQKQAPLGALRQLYQRRADATSGLPLVQLAVALQKMGDKKHAAELLASGMKFDYHYDRYHWASDYSTVVRDKALILSLLYENGLEGKQWPTLQIDLVDALHTDSYLSTQERNALVLAARYQLHERATDWKASLKTADGVQTLDAHGQTQARLEDASMLKGVSVMTDSTAPLYLRAEVSGFPTVKPKPADNKLHIAREWLTVHGTPVDPAKLQRGDLVVVHLTVTADVHVPDALVVDLLPAGFEIENQNLAKTSMALGELAELKSLVDRVQQTPVKHQEYRDDRYVTAIDVNGYEKRELVYIARAVSPGHFRVPMAMVESMYQPAVFARGAAIDGVDIK